MRRIVLSIVVILSGCEARRVEYRPVPAYMEAAGIVPEPTVLDDGTLLVYRSHHSAGKRPEARPDGVADDSGDGGGGQSRPEVALVPEQVLSELMRSIVNSDYERLYEEFLSKRTREAYEAEDKGLEEFEAFFEENRDELFMTLNRISMGMRSPEVVTERGPHGGVRIRLHRLYTKGLKFTTVDLVYEDYGLKLLMIR